MRLFKFAFLAFALLMASAVACVAQPCTETQLRERVPYLPAIMEYAPGNAVRAFSEALACDVGAPDLYRGSSGDIVAVFGEYSLTMGQGRLTFENPQGTSLLAAEDKAVLALSNQFGTDYIEVEFWTEPDKAQVLVAGVPRGTTNRQLTIREKVVQHVVLRLEGYQDCGVRGFQIEYVPWARVKCVLVPQ